MLNWIHKIPEIIQNDSNLIQKEIEIIYLDSYWFRLHAMDSDESSFASERFKLIQDWLRN